MKGFKGFDKDFKCRDFQFEVGKTYHHDGDLEICKSGFHFCDSPLHVFNFYQPSSSRFALVEANGEVLTDKNTEEHKFCTNELTIVKELSAQELITYAVDIATNTGYGSAATNTGDYSAAINTGTRSAATNAGDFSAATNTGDFSVATNAGDFSAATNTGYGSAATNAGYCSAATNTGDFSAATNTGDYSAAIVSGTASIAIVTGRASKAKAALGCWLVLTEWGDKSPIDVKAFKVDGVNILPDTFYTLQSGLPVEVKDVTS